MRRYVMSLRSFAENSQSPDRSTTRLPRCATAGYCAETGVAVSVTAMPKPHKVPRTTRAVTVMVTPRSETIRTAFANSGDRILRKSSGVRAVAHEREAEVHFIREQRPRVHRMCEAATDRFARDVSARGGSGGLSHASDSQTSAADHRGCWRHRGIQLSV